MAKFVAKRSEGGVSKTDIIAIASEAKEDARKGNKVVNASIGTFLDEDKTLGKVPLIDESLRNNITGALGYPNVYGDPEYLKGVFSYVFGDKEETINKLYHPFIGSTLGGTGAISIAFNLFLEEGETVLLPSVMWTNYMLIAKKAKDNFATYNMFTEEGGLDIKAIRESINKEFAAGKSALLVINDPCQNPTGFCMNEKEYEKLFLMLDEVGKEGKLTVLFDIAYLSFYSDPGHHFALFDELVKGQKNFLPLVAFSCSKLFGLYGLRLGALIALAHDEEEMLGIKRAFGAQARGTYSVPVGSAQYAVAQVLKDSSLHKRLNEEIEFNKDVLAKRSRMFLEEMDRAGIPHFPYMSGFFLTMKAKNAFEIAEKLKKEHIYVVPMNDDSIRLAFSGLTEEEGRFMISRIKKIL